MLIDVEAALLAATLLRRDASASADSIADTAVFAEYSAEIFADVDKDVFPSVPSDADRLPSSEDVTFRSLL